MNSFTKRIRWRGGGAGQGPAHAPIAPEAAPPRRGGVGWHPGTAEHNAARGGSRDGAAAQIALPPLAPLVQSPRPPYLTHNTECEGA